MFSEDTQEGIPQPLMAHQAALSLDRSSSSGAVLDRGGSDSLTYTLSLLKNKVLEVESLVSLCDSDYNSHDKTDPQFQAMALANLGTLIQDTIIISSSMMFTCQQLALTTTTNFLTAANVAKERELESLREWMEAAEADESMVSLEGSTKGISHSCSATKKGLLLNREKDRDIVEIGVAELLAKYSNYCTICGKGFKRDANLRMHMRAHGERYKSPAALSNPNKATDRDGNREMSAKAAVTGKCYSCPHEGCRWNQRHEKFQPLKSMICVKNHYKRRHCPKMYACQRCHCKQFSVLSDLRTHEKHCGYIRWKCSCGTTFSRKDKLMGHVALFAGHAPVADVATLVGHYS